MQFSYHREILERYPSVCGGVILASGLQNGATPPELQAAFLAEQEQALARIGSTPLSELPNLAAWRAAFRLFGEDPTKYRSAIESLLRRLTKKGDIPSINTLVDLCNLVSIRYSLPVAAFDVERLQGEISVHFANGDESFTPLEGEAAENPTPGEVIFSDASGVAVARRWCWRQSAESAAQARTRRAIFTIESQHPGGETDVSAALSDLLSLLHQYAGGVALSGLVGPNSPSFQGQ